MLNKRIGDGEKKRNRLDEASQVSELKEKYRMAHVLRNRKFSIGLSKQCTVPVSYLLSPHNEYMFEPVVNLICLSTT